MSAWSREWRCDICGAEWSTHRLGAAMAAVSGRSLWPPKDRVWTEVPWGSLLVVESREA